MHKYLKPFCEPFQMPAQKSKHYLLSCMRPQGAVGGLINPLFEVGRLRTAQWPHGSAGQAASQGGKGGNRLCQEKGWCKLFPLCNKEDA